MSKSKKLIFTSLTRIADFDKNIGFAPIPRQKWTNADYIVGKVHKISGSVLKAELKNGRMMELLEGDLVVGALGVRHATLEATGSWEQIGSDRVMHLLTGAGLMGKMTSRSVFLPPLIELKYLGHVMVDQQKTNMQDYKAEISKSPFSIPTILFVGTSMSSGKTTSSRIITRLLINMNLNVSCAKITGAGRYKDILAIKDAGATFACDFVDAGLPSSICISQKYSDALNIMLGLLADHGADVSVIEIGASPLEPYNGDIAIKAINKNVKCTVLCASDPYAVLGVMKSFDFIPTFVTGPAANTLGGIELIQKLSGIDALNLFNKNHLKRLRKILIAELNLRNY